MCADIPEVYTITCSPNVTANKTQAMAGEMITVEARSVTGQRFSAITLDGEEISRTSTATFEMPTKNVSIEAVYAQLYTISAVVPDSVEVNKSSAAFGEEVTVTLGGAFRSIITGIIVGTESIDVTDDNNTYTFNMPEGNVEITVSLNSDCEVRYFDSISEAQISSADSNVGVITVSALNYNTYEDLLISSIFVSEPGLNSYFYSQTPSNDADEYTPSLISIRIEDTITFLKVDVVKKIN